MDTKQRAGNNRTIVLTDEDRERLRPRLSTSWPTSKAIEGTAHGDCLLWAHYIPRQSIDLLILDPPYNLTKDFNGFKFTQQSIEQYTTYLKKLLSLYRPLLKWNASIYICGDWLSSVSIYAAASVFFNVRNRITWEREKGRGQEENWKNASEDIWFCTLGETYTFNVEAVKLRKKVIAPYTNEDGSPRDWADMTDGRFRDTYPSNLWTDITIPFWSMPENTDHPTQKSEKLIAKLILASSNEGDFICDPFVGSGTSSVVAKKLNRRYLGIDLLEEYCLLTERRLEIAEEEMKITQGSLFFDDQPQGEIQGMAQGIFLERNS